MGGLLKQEPVALVAPLWSRQKPTACPSVRFSDPAKWPSAVRFMPRRASMGTGCAG